MADMHTGSGSAKTRASDGTVFAGKNALRDFLHPGRSLPTPLIELPASLNPFQKEKVRIFAKATFMGPLFNIKQLGALSLLEDAQASGKLKGVHTLVESSSGNMILGIAVLARFFGIPRVVGVVDRDIAPGKLEILRLFGVDPAFSDAPPAAKSGIAKAKELGKQRGWLNLGQYGNEANPAAYEKWLAPHLWEQTGGALTVFCAGMGTTGTLVGSSRYLKKKSKRITVVGVTPVTDTVPGVRSTRRLKEITFDWPERLDRRVEIDTPSAYKASLALCRSGLLAGPSSGMALAGLLQFLGEKNERDSLDKLRNRNGEIVAAFVCPDSAMLYLEKYSTHLSPEDLRTFPEA